MDRGGEFVIEEIRVGRRKDEPSYARIQISAPNARAARPAARPRRSASAPCREDVEQVNAGARARRRRLSRRLLLDDQPRDGRAAQRAVGAGRVAGDGLRHRRRRGRRARLDGGAVGRHAGRADRRRPRGRARHAARTSAHAAAGVRVHGQQRLERKAQGAADPRDRRSGCARSARGRGGSSWSAGRCWCTRARATTWPA